MNPLYAPTVILLTLAWAWWMITTATVWADLTALAKREIRIDDFLYAGWHCRICSTHWITAPAIAWHPLYWTAINGLNVIADMAATRWLPEIEDTPTPVDVTEMAT